MNSRPSAGRAGFTLIEAIAVLVLLGLLTAFAASAFTRVSEDDDREMDRLKATIAFAQQRAMNDTVPWGVNILAKSYTLQRNGVAATLPIPGESGSTRTITSATQLTPGLILFDFRGRPINSIASPTPLTANKTIATSGGKSFTVVKNTGFIQ